MTGIILRQAALALAFGAPLFVVGTFPAAAQSACGPDIRIQRGDTLSSIARTCGVSEQALRRANPRIDWSLLRLGGVVAIPGTPDPRPGPAGGTVYIVERGDTLDDVADALGVSVVALLRANPGLSERDLVPGREIRLGDGRPRPGRPPRVRFDVAVEDDVVEPGDSVTAEVEVDGPPGPGGYTLQAGPEGRDPVVEEPFRFRRGDRVRVEIDIPRRARPGERWFVEVLDGNDDVLARDGFRIAGRRGDIGGGRITVTGRLTREGIECQALRGDDGKLYTLESRPTGFRPGDTVTVIGRTVEVSTCQQGRTIAVDRIEEAR